MCVSLLCASSSHLSRHERPPCRLHCSCSRHTPPVRCPLASQDPAALGQAAEPRPPVPGDLRPRRDGQGASSFPALFTPCPARRPPRAALWLFARASLTARHQRPFVGNKQLPLCLLAVPRVNSFAPPARTCRRCARRSSGSPSPTTSTCRTRPPPPPTPSKATSSAC